MSIMPCNCECCRKHRGEDFFGNVRADWPITTGVPPIPPPAPSPPGGSGVTDAMVAAAREAFTAAIKTRQWEDGRCTPGFVVPPSHAIRAALESAARVRQQGEGAE